MTVPSSPLHNARSITRNAALNLAGQALQMAAAVFVVPFLVRGLGTETFGAFQLVWVVLAYFSFFDLGLGRATTRFVSDALGRGAAGELPRLVGSAVTFQLLLGALGAAAVAGAAPVLATRVLGVPVALQPATITAFRIVAVAVPVTMITASYSGVLEALQRFDVLNAVRAPSGVLTLLAPLGALALGGGLVAVVASMVAVRVVTLGVVIAACRRFAPGATAGIGADWSQLRLLLSYGGWLTVSNVVGPLMVYLDRYVIGAVLGLAAVSWYTAPYDAVSRLAIFPASLVMTLFPTFSMLTAAGRARELHRLFHRGTRALLMVMVPLVLLLIAAARPLLGAWLGPDFAAHSTVPMRIILAGILVNALAQVPYAVVQGLGRPDITAKLHLAELPLYAVVLWQAVGALGIVGAAIAWSARAAVDALLLFIAAERLARRAIVAAAPPSAA